jgi:DNA-binding winged helix-turn-helix (wHTH) protein
MAGSPLQAGVLFSDMMKLIFGDCALDLEARQLWRGGVVVPLEPKMYKLLEILIKRRPSVVANEELDELLWPHVFVARTSLTRLVSQLRLVLGDAPKDSQMIRTAYKTGYAFCAEVISRSAPTGRPDGNQTQTSSGVHLVWNERQIALGEGEHIAGRGEECTILIDATTVSRRHAKITVTAAGRIIIEDLQSTNGTHVNGMQITVPTEVSNGNRIELGSESLLVKKRNASALTVRVDNLRAGREPLA